MNFFTDTPKKWEWEKEDEVSRLANGQEWVDLRISQYAVCDPDVAYDAIEEDGPGSVIYNNTAFVQAGSYVVEHNLSDDELAAPLFEKVGDKHYLLTYTEDMRDDGLFDFLEEDELFNNTVEEILQTECPDAYQGEAKLINYLLSCALVGYEIHDRFLENFEDEEDVIHESNSEYGELTLDAEDYQSIEDGNLAYAGLVFTNYDSGTISEDAVKNDDDSWNRDAIVDAMENEYFDDGYERFSFVGVN